MLCLPVKRQDDNGNLAVGVPQGTPDVVVAASVWAALVAQSAAQLAPGFASMQPTAAEVRSIVMSNIAGIGDWSNQSDAQHLHGTDITILGDDVVLAWTLGIAATKPAPFCMNLMLALAGPEGFAMIDRHDVLGLAGVTESTPA